ncbi:hypothetical protein SUGI_0344550 [Cryptomeria japonica]|nr:hypothetical protein SUGI_0344550 [Cryptomeria japonica]
MLGFFALTGLAASLLNTEIPSRACRASSATNLFRLPIKQQRNMIRRLVVNHNLLFSYILSRKSNVPMSRTHHFTQPRELVIGASNCSFWASLDFMDVLFSMQ